MEFADPYKLELARQLYNFERANQYGALSEYREPLSSVFMDNLLPSSPIEAAMNFLPLGSALGPITKTIIGKGRKLKEKIRFMVDTKTGKIKEVSQDHPLGWIDDTKYVGETQTTKEFTGGYDNPPEFFDPSQYFSIQRKIKINQGSSPLEDLFGLQQDHFYHPSRFSPKNSNLPFEIWK